MECVAILALRGGGYAAINIIPKQLCFQICKLIKILHILIYFQLCQDSFLLILVAHSGYHSGFWGAKIQGRISTAVVYWKAFRSNLTRILRMYMRRSFPPISISERKLFQYSLWGGGGLPSFFDLAV